MPISNLRGLFQHELADLYSVESQIIESLPMMIDAASNEELRAALTEHLEVTKEQRARLEVISKEVDFDKNMTCEGMKGILKEGETGMEEITDPATLDAAIITSAQRVEHYEIAAYGGAIEFAKQLDMTDIADTLQESLDEEKSADESLSGLATGGLFTKGLNEEAEDSDSAE